MTYHPKNPYAPKPVEVSLTTLGRAKAKGTTQSWVDPRHDMYSPLYQREKSGYIDTRGIPLTPSATPADDTNAPLTSYLMQRLYGAPPVTPTPLAQVAALLGLR